MKFAKMPEDTGAVLSEPESDSPDDDETSGDESEAERERRLEELASNVSERSHA